MPDMTTSLRNSKASLHMSCGCQCIGMSYQIKDSELQFYEKKFEENGTAFILKPKDLRYEPKLIKKPKKQTKAVSFEPNCLQIKGMKQGLAI